MNTAAANSAPKKNGRPTIASTRTMSLAEIIAVDGFLSIEEAASIIGCSCEKLRLDEKAGLLAFVRNGRMTRIWASEFQRYRREVFT